MLDIDFKKEASAIEDYLRDYTQQLAARMPKSANKLYESMHYSLFNGGKRFRPVLSLFTARALSLDLTKVLPFACAVEMVHTYSLIHDDLPCMDDDDLRRGQPTNHKVYGENTALLAGDALLTEAFYLLANSYAKFPEIGIELMRLFGEAAGTEGMITGQVMDLSASENDMDVLSLAEMHRLKTGALIRLSVEGVAVIARMEKDQRSRLRKFGEDLGKAFQLADDIHDFDPAKPEASGYPAKIGLEKTKELLDEISDSALLVAESIGSKNHLLSGLVKYNQTRLH